MTARERYNTAYRFIRREKNGSWSANYPMLMNYVGTVIVTHALRSAQIKEYDKLTMMPAFWYKAVAEYRANKARAALKPHDCPYCNGNQGGHDDCPMCQGTGVHPDFIQWHKERLF